MEAISRPVLAHISSALGRADQAPNEELAQRIAENNDSGAVTELIENLAHESRTVQSDCIKVLYEIGAREPQLISPYFRQFARLLQSRNNRLQWGAMKALDSIASVEPAKIFALLPEILAAATRGSVITRDHATAILVKLARIKKYSAACMPELLQALKTSPNNQFPMYAENALPAVNSSSKKQFAKVLADRAKKLEKDSQKKRVLKVLRKVEAIGT